MSQDNGAPQPNYPSQPGVPHPPASSQQLPPYQQSAAPQPPYAQPASPQPPYQQAASPQPPHQQAASPQQALVPQPPPYQQQTAAPHSYQPYAPAEPINPMATTAFIAALVSPAAWLLSFVPVLGSILMILSPISALIAVIFGHIALSQLKKKPQRGRGFALTGVIVGYILIGLSLIFFVFAFALFGMLLGGIGAAGGFGA